MAQNTDIGTAVVSEMSSSDQVIKFLLENKSSAVLSMKLLKGDLIALRP